MKQIKKGLLFLAILSLVFSACRSGQKATGSENESQTSLKTDCAPLLLSEVPFHELESDYFELLSARIEDDCLQLIVSYSGGCGSVDFSLYRTQQIMKSMPPQTNIFLSLTDNDPCRELIQDTLWFDLRPYTSYAGSGGIVLKLQQQDEGLLYKHP